MFVCKVLCDSCKEVCGPEMGSLGGAESAAKRDGWDGHVCPRCVSTRNKKQMKLFR